jgi:uncharacterized protein (TIGR03067 family)
MKRLFGVLLLAGAALAVGADDKKDDAAKAELKKFQGTWLLVSGEENGEKISADAAKMMKAIVKDDKVSIYMGDKVVGEATFTIDPSKKPKEIDSVSTMGPDKGKKSLGIYEFDGDTFKICITDGKERPKEFNAKKGSGCGLFEYKREKK